MCGIVGFTGSAQAAPILLDGLSKLEYRGYDSAGLAVQNAAGKIEVVKAKGRLRVLSEMTDEGKAVQGCCGIGHTRWATHGEPSVVNAHPHYSRDQKIAVVHNGIIENYQELKTRLINKGFTFVSQTDTEVVAQLLDYYYTGVSAGDSLDAITRMMMHVRGSYALGILFADQPGVVYAVRKDSPLIVGKAENGSLIASDVPALLKYTRTVYYIDNLEIARLTPDSIEFFNIDKEPVEKEASTIEWDAEAAEKGGYEHFMMKEIDHQQKTLRSGEGGGDSTGAQRTVHSTCGASLGLHFNNLDLVPENVLQAGGAPLVNSVCHRAGGGNRVDGSNIGKRISYMRSRGIAIHGLFCSWHFFSSVY